MEDETYYIVSVLKPTVVSQTVDHVDEELLRNAVLGVVLAINVATELLPLHPSLPIKTNRQNVPWEESERGRYRGRKPRQ